MEKRLLEKWYKKGGVVEKYLSRNQDSQKRFSFIDGPITANNAMGLHHARGRSYKDLWQRYKNMQGYKQRFQNGFDCQGLWVEVEVEKELGFNSKKDILDYGMGEFTNACKARVNKYAGVQTEQSKRLGMFMDWDNSYFTFSETNNLYIWKFLKKCYEQDMIYKNQASTTWCPRCETGLSEHEKADGYKTVKDESVYVKFPLKDKENEYFLVWTTTPWTLAANVLLSINTEFDYVKAKVDGETWYLAQKSADRLNLNEYEPVDAKALLSLKYEPLYDDLSAQKSIKKGHYVVEWDEVDPSEGTGIVHIAPGCGEEDFLLGQELGVDVLSPLDEGGRYGEGYGDLTGKYAHDVGPEVIKTLTDKGLFYKTETVTHSYPHCWRCKTKCLFRLEDNWFIDLKDLKPKLKEAASKANWRPEYVEKRMHDWLENMGDWMISRQRVYGLSLPFYECKKCGEMTVVGSKEELKKLATEPEKVDDLPSLHRPWIDEIKIKCPKCDQVVKRIPDVGDCWLDAGVVPFSTLKYFEDKDYWKKWFPAEFICEMFEQVRLWYYSMLVYGVIFEDEVPYQNVLSYAHVVDENGDAFHKSGDNNIPLDEAAEKMGSDVVRWIYATQSTPSKVRIGYSIADDVKRSFYLPFWNIYKYFVIYANLHDFDQNDVTLDDLSVLDEWVLAELNDLVKFTIEKLDEYDVNPVARKVEVFVKNLSTWYIRRSRDRFADGDTAALSTLYTVMERLVRLLAPIMPFVTEEIYNNLRTDDMPESVHLADYPVIDKEFENSKNQEKMRKVREVCTLGQAARVETKNKVRQPLAELQIKGVELDEAYLELVADELNVRNVKITKNLPEDDHWNVQEDGGLSVALNTELDDELKMEGLYREVARQIQNARKKAGLKMGEEVEIVLVSDSKEVASLAKEKESGFKNDVSAKSVSVESNQSGENTSERIFVKIKA